MIIKNLNNQYYVVEKLKSIRDFDLFFCKLLDSDDNRNFDIIKVKNRDKIPDLVRIFADFQKNVFTDLYECFSLNGFFYIVFLHNKGKTLREKLDIENCSLRERLEIGKKILERVILLAMPDFLLLQVTNLDNILIAEDLTMSFSYRISSIDQVEGDCFPLIVANLADLMEQLFVQELENEEIEDVQQFIDVCHDYKFQEILEFYQEYSRFYDVIMNQSEGGYIRPNTLAFRIWAKIKESIPVVKNWVLRIVFVIMIFFMIKALFAQGDKAGTNFAKIGTVEIHSMEQKE